MFVPGQPNDLHKRLSWLDLLHITVDRRSATLGQENDAKGVNKDAI
jgi:hypothetical protein